MSDLREALEGAFESAGEESGQTTDVGPIETAGASTGSGEDASGGTATPDVAPEAKAPAPARARDEAGKFAKASSAPKANATKALAPKETSLSSEPAKTVPGTTGNQAEPVAATPTPEVKAPQSWKPAAREKWAALPPEVQQEAVRVDREVRQVMQEAAASRKFHQSFNEVFSPYMGMIQAEGSEPLQAMGRLLQTAAALRTAPPTHKAQLVAQMVKMYGVPIDALDAALAGQAPPQGQAQGVDPTAIARQVHQSIMQDFQRQRSQAAAQNGHKEVAAFVEGKEFIEDVRETMADILDLRARQGIQTSLEDAYKMALKLHPEVSGVIAQREAAKAAQSANVSTLRAKNAASSVRSQPTSAPVNGRESRNLRDDLEAAISAASGR